MDESTGLPQKRHEEAPVIGRDRVRQSAIPLVAAGLAVIAGACGDPTASWADFDPDRAVDHLDDVMHPLDVGGDFLLALDLVVATLEYHGASLASAVSPRPEGVGEVGRRLRGMHLPSAVDRSQRPAPSVPDAVARFGIDHPEHLPGDGGALTELGALTLPWELRGETLEWDPYDGYVVSGRSGAPQNGVRFELYRMDPQEGYPTSQLARIGYIDFIDEDVGSTEAVRVRGVRTGGSSRVIADYRVTLSESGSYSDGEILLTTRGIMGDIAHVDLNLSQRFQWSRSRDREQLDLDYRYGRGSTTVVLDGRAFSRYEAAEWETFDFESEIRSGRSTTGIDATIARSGALDGYVLMNGRRVVRIRGYDGRPTFERFDGGRLDWYDQASLEDLWTGMTDLLWITDWIMVPADVLLLSG